MAILVYWLFGSYPFLEIVGSVYIAALGMFIWTFTEYYYHRFLLHPEKLPEGVFFPHLVHHAFPNLKNRIAQPFMSNNITLTVIFITLYYAFNLLVCL